MLSFHQALMLLLSWISVFANIYKVLPVILPKPAVVLLLVKEVSHFLQRKPRDYFSQLFMSVENLLGITYRIKHDLHIMPGYNSSW